MPDERVVVVGAGPGGLATAGALRQRGGDALVLERGDGVAAKWRASYDSLHINTSTWFSFLPGMRFPRGSGQWPARDDLVAYYEAYVERFALRIRTRTEVLRVDRTHDGWRLDTTSGALRARTVVIATAKDRVPVVARWPGSDDFAGRLMHAAEYRNPVPFAGARVVVAGAGNSGFDIALDLLSGETRDVVLSIRTPPHVMRRAIGPLPSDVLAVLTRRLPSRLVDHGAHLLRIRNRGYVRERRLGRPPLGLKTTVERTGRIPTIDPGTFVAAVRDGRLPVRPGVERLTPTGVVFADGTTLRADAVIAATGYHPGLGPLVGHLGLLDGDGSPIVHGRDTAPQAPRLHFVGFSRPSSGNLRELRLDARRIARAIVST